MLNIEQENIIKSSSKKIFVLAGAGTGKSYTIIKKIESILEQKVDPSKILCISFTEKSATSLKERLNNDLIDVSTFHKFCYDYLKSQNYNKTIFKNTLYKKEDLNKISKYKNSLIKIKPFIYEEYNRYLKESNMVDFDDLFLDFLNTKYNKDYEYIFVDEFQDTNPLQYKVLKKIIKENTTVICVGDIKQSIYAFRGSDKKVIKRFIKDYNAAILTLTTNYRSKKNLITFFNKIIKPLITLNFSMLRSNTEENGKICIKKYLDEEKEAEDIVYCIKKFLCKGYKKKDILILARDEVRLYKIKEEIYKNYLNISSLDNQIKLLTVHSAKGLEAKIVFLVGLEKTRFPNLYDNTISCYYEEKRLFYVAITRAKEYLFLSYTKTFLDQYYQPSIFYYLSLLKSK